MQKTNRPAVKKQPKAFISWKATADEMRDARQWRISMLKTLCGGGKKRALLTCLRQGWGQMHVDLAVAGGPLCLAGKIYPTGIGAHGECDLQVILPAGSRRLTGRCGIDDNGVTRSRVADQSFSIELDEREVWDSGPRGVASPAAQFSVPLRGARIALLKVRGPIPHAHVDWVNLRVDGVPVRALQDACGDAFSFRYAGRPSRGLLACWKRHTTRRVARETVRDCLTWTDPETGLAVVCELTAYTRFPVVEWVTRLANTSSRPTPLIEELRSMDLSFRVGQFPYLHYRTGDHCSPDGYEAFRVSLAHGEEFRFAPLGGRGTNRAWPYYNLEWPDAARGIVVVVGWAGQWASRIAGDFKDPSTVQITAGQQTTHFRLRPGEEVRTPTSLLMFYRGGRARSQNLWRRWYREHALPRPGGRRMRPHLAAHGTDEGEEFTAATEANQLRYIKSWAKRNIPFDVWWIDAGWYPCRDAQNAQRSWPTTGTWRPDPERFPRGFKPISDALARRGVKLLVWFEPERVRPGTALDREHPEWLLRFPGAQDRLLDLGKPACRKWLTDHVCRLIRENGIGIYRQDFNFDPLRYWQANDTPDRRGITENLYVQGYLKYWDDLLARNPGLWIDSCASGGRRNDLDTMRRAVPLHYSDAAYGDPPVKLAFHDGLFQWLPYFKECTAAWDLRGHHRFDHTVDSFSCHCGFSPMLLPSLDIRRDDYDYALLRKLVKIWRRVAPLMLAGDYYALAAVRRTPDQWVARQFDRPETGAGFIQVIRLPKAPARQMIVHPQALQPEAAYVFENPETGAVRRLTGAGVIRDGILFSLPPRAGAVWFYRRAGK